MNAKAIIFALGGFLAGCGIGFIAGSNIMKQRVEAEEAAKRADEEAKEKAVSTEKKEEKKVEEFSSFDPSKIKSKPAKIATPEKDGINYSAYATKVEELNYKAESESPKDSDEDDSDISDDDDEPEMETYEERVQRDNEEVANEFEIYKQKKKKPFYILGNENVDTDYPDIRYEEHTLFYFTMDDILSTEEGDPVDEATTVGTDLRKFGWFKNASDHVWVRNMEQEKDYKIDKQQTSYEDFFGTSKLPDIDEA